MATSLKCLVASGTQINLCVNGTLQETIKCFFCEKFLSVAPIYSHEHESICGRCKFVPKPEATKWARQTLYEEMAKFMLFPCSNVSYGCSAQLSWDEVEEHENTCLYKKLSCPFANDIFMNERCKWTGSGPGLNEHLENCHGDLIKKLSDLNLSEIKSNCIFLTRIAKQLMIITIKFQVPDKFAFLVMVNGISTNCDAYRYQLELFDEIRKNSLLFRRNRLEDAVGFEENFNDADRSLNFSLSTVSDLLKNPETIMARIGVLKKAKKELSGGANHSFNMPRESVFDENFLRELECPICKNYMVPPISICATGHSFCLNCKQQMTECPTCRHPFQQGRNYTLEKLSSCVNYPCMFREAGCTVVCSGEKIKAHESDCSFSGSLCFFNCSNCNVMNMFRHLKEKHHDSLIVSGEIHLLDVTEVAGNDRIFAICFGNDIFRLTVKYDGGLTFCVQQFGVQQPSYSYEIEIIYSNECLEKVVLAKQCSPLSVDIWKQSIDLPAEMVDGFISDEDLIFFKVHLQK